MSETLKDKRILLVDDDSDILTSMQAAFEPTGAEVDTAATGTRRSSWWRRTSRTWSCWT